VKSAFSVSSAASRLAAPETIPRETNLGQACDSPLIVWGWKHTSSNVVEAVVRTLRKKLGDKSSLIDTIRGSGYRLRKF